jgi:CRISPR/Cas system-associated exonuclease Cas4 (RecB family)
VTAGLALVLLGTLLVLLARQAYRRSGLPPGVPVYIDTGNLETPDTLFDPDWRLAGRPDFIVRHGRSLIPVEVKTGHTPAQPYKAHTLQLAAYMRLIKVQNGRRPGHGFIVYPQASFRVRNTRQLERDLSQTVSRMRASTASLPQRSHASLERCRACGFLSVCDQALDS